MVDLCPFFSSINILVFPLKNKCYKVGLWDRIRGIKDLYAHNEERLLDVPECSFVIFIRDVNNKECLIVNIRLVNILLGGIVCIIVQFYVNS